MPKENEIGFTTVEPTTEPNENHMDAAEEAACTPYGVEGPKEHPGDPGTPEATKPEPAKSRSRGSKSTAKARTYVELAEIAPAKMTEKELRLCVENLRVELTLANNKCEMLDQNAKRAYDQCRQLQMVIQQKDAEYNNTIAFINQSTSVFARGVLLATQKGDK